MVCDKVRQCSGGAAVYSCGCDTSHTLPISPAGCNDHDASESFHSYIKSIWLAAQVCGIYPPAWRCKQLCDCANAVWSDAVMSDFDGRMTKLRAKLLSPSTGSKSCSTTPLYALLRGKKNTSFSLFLSFFLLLNKEWQISKLTAVSAVTQLRRNSGTQCSGNQLILCFCFFSAMSRDLMPQQLVLFQMSYLMILIEVRMHSHIHCVFRRKCPAGWKCMSGIVSHSVMIFLCYFKWSEHSEIVQIIAFLFVLSVFRLQGRVEKIDKNNRIPLKTKLSVLLLSLRTDSKGVSLQTEHFHILEMSKCPGTSTDWYISTKVGHYSTLCLAPGLMM